MKQWMLVSPKGVPVVKSDGSREIALYSSQEEAALVLSKVPVLMAEGFTPKVFQKTPPRE